MTDLRYPIGQFEFTGPISRELLNGWIEEIESLPAQVRGSVESMSEKQLDTPYRLGGWTVRQVVHHLPDSHMNAYIRFKWALTENEPLIKTYLDGLWAELPDYKAAVGPSLDLLESLHARWVLLLRGLSEEQLSRRFLHPKSGLIELSNAVGNYAWHGRHHLAHVDSVRVRLSAR